MSAAKPYRVLCVCLGNICRSPTAEQILRHMALQHGLAVELDSAGTSNYHPNKAPDPRSLAHALEAGYDLSGLRARQVQLQDFALFDLILAMDHDNLSKLNALQQRAIQSLGASAKRAHLALMSEHDASYPKQAVPDPYYGNTNDFKRVIQQCESSALAWVKQWSKQALG